jgi:hypothetical protein
MTDFLNELEVQLTAAAHRAVAERARPPRPKRWPTLSFVAAAAVAVAAMVGMPTLNRPDTDGAGNAKLTSLQDARIGVYNAAGTNSVASPATAALSKRGARATAGTVPAGRERAYSKIYFAKGHAGQARSVGRALGVDRVGSPLPNLHDGRTYDVVVLLGKDFATPAKRLLDGFALLREATNRTIDTAAGPVRVIATHGGLCLQVRENGDWGGSCVDVADALAGKAVTSLRAPGGRLRGAVGLVPDGVEAVELELTDGTTRRLPVGRNVWAVGAERIVSARFDGTTIRVP